MAHPDLRFPWAGYCTTLKFYRIFWALPALFSLSFADPDATLQTIGRVLSVLSRGRQTILLVRLEKPLEPGTIVRIGKTEFAILGRESEAEGRAVVFEAMIPEESKAKRGDPVYEIPYGPGIKAEGPEMTITIRKIPWMPKRLGRIKIAEENRALIDRGSLHQVAPKDLFAVYDSSGRFKGYLEVGGVGDAQAIAYAQKDNQDIQQNYTIVYIGQRKLFRLGPSFGLSYARGRLSKTTRGKPNISAGVLYSHLFSGGWGLDFLAGFTTIGIVVDIMKAGDIKDSWSAKDIYFYAPFRIRKSLFYPRMFSPFLSAGISIYNAEVLRSKSRVNEHGISVETISSQRSKPFLPAPTVSIGVELFPARFLSGRLELQVFWAPPVLGHAVWVLAPTLTFSTGWAG